MDDVDCRERGNGDENARDSAVSVSDVDSCGHGRDTDPGWNSRALQPLPAHNSRHQFSLKIVQQPIRARVCGYSIMDRRPIHPPPIVSLCGPDACESRPLVVFTSLWSSDLSVNVSISNNRNQGPTLSYIPGTDAQEYRVIPGEGYILSQMLMGALVTTGIFLLDNQNREGIFFIFKDLAVRSSGLYRLKFELYDPFSKAYGSPPMATVVSDVFQVFSPKTYPGITPTTSLSRCFAQQGAKIRLRPNANIARNDTGGDKTVSPTVDDDH